MGTLPLRLVALLLPLALSACGAELRRDRPPHIVLLVIDTLRADHLPSYGYPLDTAPHLAQLAEAGVLFERVVAPSSWTKTSMASIVTGLAPATHGVLRHRNAVPRGLVTLAEQLAAHGYETIGINTNPWLQEQFGFGAGFEVYETIRHAKESGHAVEVNRRALELLARSVGDRPVFLYLHYMDVHAPYRSVDEGGSRAAVRLADGRTIDDDALELAYRKHGLADPGVAERVIELYDAGIRAADRATDQLLGALADFLPAEDTLVVVTSDHGEAFREHGRTEHGHDLYPEVLGVPLIFAWPSELPRGVRIAAQVRSIDVAPTVLALAGVALPAGLEGAPLLPMRPGAIADRVAHSEVYFRRPLEPFHFTAVVSPDHLYVHELLSGTVEFYDLREDPGARRDLGDQHPRVASYRDRERSADVEGPAERAIDTETRAELEALGYLQ